MKKELPTRVVQLCSPTVGFARRLPSDFGKAVQIVRHKQKKTFASRLSAFIATTMLVGMLATGVYAENPNIDGSDKVQKTVEASPRGHRIIQGNKQSTISIIRMCVEGHDTKIRKPGFGTFTFDDEAGMGWRRCSPLEIPIELEPGDELICIGSSGKCTIEYTETRIKPPDLDVVEGGVIITLYKEGKFQSRAKASPSGTRMLTGKISQPFTITEFCIKGSDTKIHLVGVGPVRLYADECYELAKPLDLPSSTEFICVGGKGGECIIRGRMR